VFVAAIFSLPWLSGIHVLGFDQRSLGEIMQVEFLVLVSGLFLIFPVMLPAETRYGQIVRWRHDLSSAVTVSPGVGLGYYSLSIDEYETYYYGWWWGYDTRTLYDDSALGGFVSLAVDFKTSAWGAFRIDNKLHFAEFDNLDNLTPNESNVHGPIYTLAIGFVYGF
jgi:hypothetical protein